MYDDGNPCTCVGKGGERPNLEDRSIPQCFMMVWKGFNGVEKKGLMVLKSLRKRVSQFPCGFPKAQIHKKNRCNP